MLNKIQKTVVSKPFLISLIIVCLMFASLGVNVEHAYAADVNDTDEMELDVNVEDKLENSHETKLMLENTQENPTLQAKTYSVTGGTFSDIQNAIDNATDGDTIKLSGKFTSKGDDTLLLKKKLTITSSSQATLDGKNNGVILRIFKGAANSQLSNLKFINGYSDSKGGAILITAQNVAFNKCVFENNSAELSSGAIHTQYNAVSAQGMRIKNCNFTGNHAGIAAGALGIFAHDFLIENCVFNSNYVKGDGECYGGAVQLGLDTEPSYGNVKNCLFVNNKAISSVGLGHAGAGCVRNGSSYYNCVFIGNTADWGSALTYHASGNLDNCTLINNTATKYGGAVAIMLNYLDYMDLNITNSVFKGNKAPLGGAVKLDGLNIKIENSLFEDNYASEYGGAVNINATNVKVINSEFNRNIANIDGGALFITGKDTVVRNSKFTSNEAIPDASKLNDGLGGAIYVNSTMVLAQNNEFKLNTARNGSAIYFDKDGVEFKLANNTLYQNQAWVYKLPISAHDIYYGDVENIKSVIYGGNNIADFDNINVSNAIYNAAGNDKIQIDGENPVLGAVDTGELYQDDREYNMNVLMTVQNEDGTVVYNKSSNTNYLGEVSDSLEDLKPGKYYVTAKHYEDNYYKSITNETVFNVLPKTDNKILKASNNDSIAYEDTVVWTLNITNNGPNDATGVIVTDVLPEGLIWICDDSNGAYDPKTGILTIGSLKVGETLIVNIITKVNKTGEIKNEANVTGNEYDIDLDNNHDEQEITVPPTVDVSVIKDVNVSNPNYGDLIEWIITVSNFGPDVAHDVNVTDLLPVSLEFVSSDGDYDVSTGVWNVGDLEVNNSVKLSLVCRVASTGVINNKVDVTSREIDRNMSNNHYEKQISTPETVDLEVIKDVNISNPKFGDLVEWTVTVSNFGPDVAHDVNVTDLLPVSLEFVSSDGDYDVSTGVWNVGDLKVNGTTKLTIVSKVIATGNIVNNAEVISREVDCNLSNNHDEEEIDVPPAVDLEVGKLVNETNPNFKNQVKWTIIVKNNGPDDAHGVKVTDLFSNALIWISDDSLGRYDSKTGIWDIGTLNKGETIELNIISQVNQTGNITNNVSVNSLEDDIDLTNNEANKTILVNKSGDLAIVKTVNVTEANYGELIKWTLTASNNGPDKVTGVTVQDILPEGFVLVNYTASKGFYDEGVWVVCCLEKGEIETLELVCKVIRTGNITNIAEISGIEYDPNLDNNMDNESIEVPPASDISVIKQVTEDNPYFGDIVTWIIKVTNNGPDRANNVKVTDVLPYGLVFNSYSSTCGVYENGVWVIDYLNVGQSECLNISCHVNELGVIVNNVSVMADEYDVDMSNNHDDELIDVLPVSDLSIEKFANVSTANYNDLVKWTVIVSNNGPNCATGVFIQDILPNSLKLISANGNYENGIWYVGDLDVGESKALEIITKIIKTGNITNVAKANGNEKDPNPNNNEDNGTIYVKPAADLSITKTVSKYTYNVGEIVAYSIKVNNNGPADAVNVRVSEKFPKSLTLKSVEQSTGEFDTSNNVWSIEKLAAGGEEKLLVKFEATSEGIFENVASVVSDTPDDNLENNNDSATVEIINNTSNDIVSNITGNFSENNVAHAENIKQPVYGLSKNPTSNLISLLAISAIISIIFGSNDIFRKR